MITFPALSDPIGSVIGLVQPRGCQRDQPEGQSSVEGLEPIISYLDESDASQVNLPELKNIIDDLEANYLISVDGDTFTANNWDALGESRIDEHARFFTDCEDPLSGDPFLDWWDSRRDENETRGSDLFSDPELESTGKSVGSDVNVKEQTVDFDVDAEPWVADVLGQIQTALDGTRVPDMSQLTVEGFISLTAPDSSSLTSVSTTGSMLDPEHAVWDVDDKADSWVTTETDARRYIQQAIQQLMELGHIDIARVHKSENGEPVDVTLAVGDS
jgi:hypothetical protein